MVSPLVASRLSAPILPFGTPDAARRRSGRTNERNIAVFRSSNCSAPLRLLPLSPLAGDGRRQQGRALFQDPSCLSPSPRTSIARSGTHSFPERYARPRPYPRVQADRRGGPGSALTLGRGDTERQKGAWPKSSHPSMRTCQPALLILRKREALSRRMGRLAQRLPPILRDGPDGPPQDEGRTLFGASIPALPPAGPA